MKKIILIISAVLIIIFTYTFFSKEEKINIGFVAGLSGKYSTLGNSVLNGLQLAFDDVDYKVANKKIVLIEKDDKQSEEKAKEAIRYFKENNIKLIVGNSTSSMTKISLNEIKNSDEVLISATASSNEFSNIDDNFLRMQVAHTTKRFDILSKYLIENDLKRIYMIYDPMNKSYSKNYIINFQQSFINNGGQKFINTEVITKNFYEILEDINKREIDTIVVVANSMDSSKMIQFLKVNNIKQKIISSGWAKTKDFLENGGKYIEGVVFSTGYDDNSDKEYYKDFIEKYYKKYKSKPSVFAAQAYETGKVLINMLEKDSNISNLKANILKQKVFEGLQGKIIFNKYGDVDRDYFLMYVKDNTFKRLK